MAPLAIIGYLFALRSDWITHAQLSVPGKRPLFSDRLDLAKPGVQVWSVPLDHWGIRPPRAQLRLTLNLSLLREVPADREHVELRARISVDAIGPDGSTENLLATAPFPGKGLGESYGSGRVEYDLAYFDIPREKELRITVTVLTPDSQLALGNPRLKMVVSHDYAAKGQISALLCILQEGGVWVCTMFVLGLTVLAWKTGSKTKPGV